MSPETACSNSCARCSAISACTSTISSRAGPTWRTRSRSRASPTRRAPAASARTPRPRRSTPTARPTSSTTCTSSTRASSRASRRSTPRSRRWRTLCASATICCSSWARMGADAQSGRLRKVVIVGGGFGGLTAARELGGADLEVTLVDPTSHHLFQPLLYQLACGGLSTGECASPIRAAVKHSPNTTVLMAKATGLDAERRRLTLDRGETLDYDSLIVACGAETSYFGNDAWCEHTCGLKTLTDAVELRNRLYSAFEQAERAEDPAEREKWLTFVVSGGGATGVELAGELAIIAHDTMKGYFTRSDPATARVILLDAGERLTAAFNEKLSAKVAKYLAELGVTVRQGARVTG